MRDYMSKVRWKENSLVSIKIKDNCFILAQMLISPVLVFYKTYSETNIWENISLKDESVLFTCSVTRPFLTNTEIIEIKDVSPIPHPYIFHKIRTFSSGTREVVFQEGKCEEIKFIELGSKPGGCLIEKDISKAISDLPNGYPIIMDTIPIDDDDTINKYELDAVRIYPELNERLFLCHKFGSSVDPAKDIAFDRYLPIEYKKYIQIVSGSVKLNELGY